MAKINRITIRLDDDLLSRLEAHADRQRRSLADVVRLVLDDHLPEQRIIEQERAA